MLDNSKILPLKDPIISGYPKHAIQLSVLSQHRSSFSWIMSNYIQTKCSKKINDEKYVSWFDFYFIDPKYTDSLLYTELLSRTTVLKFYGNELSQFLIECINLGYYIYTSVNEFYIPNTPAYQKYYYPHSILLYGYDNLQKSFHVGGFTSNKGEGRKFSKFQVSFADVERAYKSIENIENEHYLSRFYLMKINNSISYDFDVIHVKELLIDYLFSKNTSERFRGYFNPTEDFYFGMKVYENLKLLYGADRYMTEAEIRPLHLLWEHKKCMLSRIDFMINQGFLKDSTIYDEYKEVELLMLKCRNVFLKYRLSQEKNGFLSKIPKIGILLDKVIDKESKAINRLLSEIQITRYH